MLRKLKKVIINNLQKLTGNISAQVEMKYTIPKQ